MASSFGGLSPWSFIAPYVAEGRSVRSFLSDFRQAGGRIADVTARTLYGQVREAAARAGVVAGLDDDRMPGDQDYSEWSTRRGRGFATHLMYQRRETGAKEILRGEYVHITSEPHTIGEAKSALLTDLPEEDQEGNRYGFEILGAVAVGLYRVVPYSE